MSHPILALARHDAMGNAGHLTDLNIESGMRAIPSVVTEAFGNPSRRDQILRWSLGSVMLGRLLFPFFNSPLHHLFSDPERHWNNGIHFLHPTMMSGQDPFLYQLWMFLLQHAGTENSAVIVLGTGLLCTLMPYGWYRALKELLPRSWAMCGAIIMGLVPAFLGIYAYFMNETLLLTLTGFAFWFTFRAYRKRSVSAFALACIFWLAAGFTRAIALPLGLGCIGFIWLTQGQKVPKALLGLLFLVMIAVPAGLHAEKVLHFFSPFGNIYLNDIYRESGKKVISIDFGPQGRYVFGSPSFYNPTLYPFSDWTTDRTGTVSIRIDPTKGRADWIAEEARVSRNRTFPLLDDYWENFVYLCFAQAWPDNDRTTLSGWLTVWTRWLWPILILLVAVGAARRRFSGIEWLLPACALGMFAFLMVQRAGVMEGRFRKPIDPIFVASAVVMLYRWRRPGSRSS